MKITLKQFIGRVIREPVILLKLIRAPFRSTKSVVLDIYNQTKKEAPGRTENEYFKFVLLTNHLFEYQDDVVINQMLIKYKTIDDLADAISGAYGVEFFWNERKNNLKRCKDELIKRNVSFLKEFNGSEIESAGNDESYIRKFADKCRSVADTEKVSFEGFFGSVIYLLSVFGKKEKGESVPKEWKGFGLDASEFYSGDNALFELGCYLCFRIDLWFLKNKPHLRKEIVLQFIEEYEKLFSRALEKDIEDISFILDRRMSGYGKLVREGEKLEQYHYHLSQLIMRTKGGELPKLYDYDFDNAPLLIKGALEDFGVKVAIQSWEGHILPEIFKNIEKYCSLI